MDTAMDATAIRELLAPYLPSSSIDEPLLSSIQAHLDLLLRWNQHMNLTALRTAEEIVPRHFGESLFAANALLPRTSTQDAFDVGSGAGFPGLPFKYWAPQLRLTLIEGHGKKATFLREVGRALHLSDYSVLNARAESVTQTATLVTMRAVEKFEHALTSAAKLVSPGGRLALLIGESQHQRAVTLLPEGASTVLPLPSSDQTILLTWTRPS
jgi:16S rRNA (guanine527-N7)-methyltransferase